jgi:hypothetical protein
MQYGMTQLAEDEVDQSVEESAGVCIFKER